MNLKSQICLEFITDGVTDIELTAI